MRISALTITARMSPCARAISTSPVGVALSFAIMMAAPPTKTRAKVPMNSATKWRHESRIAGSVTGESRSGLQLRTTSYPLSALRGQLLAENGVSVYAPKDQCRVDSTESEGIRENVVDASAAAASGQKVKIARIIGNGEVHGRWKPFLLHRQRANCRLDRARRAERMAVISLCAAHRQTVRVVAEHVLDRERFSWIVERSGAAVGVDVIDLSR